MKFLRYYPDYEKALMEKMCKGHKTYGDKSFSMPMLQIIKEIEDELLDVNGWSIVLYGRLQELKKTVTKLRLLFIESTKSG